MKKTNNTLIQYWKSEPKEVIMSTVFLVTLTMLVYFAMWGADVLGLLNN
jgi:hypothetical protein